MSNLVEVIFVELSHEAGEVAMFEVFGKDRLCESLILRKKSARAIEGIYPHASYLEYDKTSAVVAPPDDLRV